MALLTLTFLVSLVVFHGLERVLPPIREGYRTGPLRRGYAADLFSSIVNGSGLSLATRALAYGVLLYVPTWHDVLSGWSWWGQFALFFVVDDLGRYVLHVAYHRVPWLWRAHRVHHAITEMDAMSLLRVHAIEGSGKALLIALPFHVLGLDPTVFTAYLAMDLVKGFWHHANFRTYIGPLNYLLVSAELHWWHHAADGPGAQSNYGNKLAIWDWMFGTAYWPRGTWPERIGVPGMDDFPSDWIGQLVSVRDDDDALIARLRGSEAPAVADAQAPAPAK